MTAPHEAGAGPEIWLDMSRYPDTDPDAALTGEEQDLLSSSLAVDDADLPDAVWEHMLGVVTGADDADPDAEADPADPTDPADTATDDWAAGGWDTDPVLHDHGDDPGFDAGDAAGDDHAGHADGTWDGGAV